MKDQNTLPGMRRTEPADAIDDDSAHGFVGAPHARTITSKAAAQKIVPKRMSIQKRIYEFIHIRGGFGATAEEIEITMKIKGNTVRPRLIELQESGRVFKSACTRKTTSGRQARVYVAESALRDRELT